MTLKPNRSKADSPAARRRIGRRRLLQALMTSGVLVAANLTPERWISPVIEVGLLPAHAQISPPSVLPVLLTKPSTVPIDQTCVSSAGHSGLRYRVGVTYNSSRGQVESEIKIRHDFELRPFGPSGSFVKSGPDLTLTGDNFQGTMAYSMCVAFGSNTELVTTMVLNDVNDKALGTITFTTPKPPGALGGQKDEGFVDP